MPFPQEVVMSEDVHTLVYSSNHGRYSFDDSEHGHDITSGELISIEVMKGVWVDGRVERSGRYAIDTAGLYSIEDSGMPKDNSIREPLTEEKLQQAIQRGMREGMSLADAIRAAEGLTVGIFRGYYFISTDGQIIGLCTGMRVRSR